MSSQPGSTAPADAPAWKYHARRVALIYCVFSSLWILMTDKAVFHLMPEGSSIEWSNISKGLLFVVVTAS